MTTTPTHDRIVTPLYDQALENMLDGEPTCDRDDKSARFIIGNPCGHKMSPWCADCVGKLRQLFAAYPRQQRECLTCGHTFYLPAMTIRPI